MIARERLAAAANSRGLKFLIVGGISYVVNQATLYLLYEFAFTSLPSVATRFGEWDMALFVSSLVAVEVSIIARFVMNDQWTFREHRESRLLPRFVRSNIVSVTSPIIALATVNTLTPIFGVHYLVANSIGIVLGLAVNWIGSTRLVWRTPTTPAGVTVTTRE